LHARRDDENWLAVSTTARNVLFLITDQQTAEDRAR